MLKVAFAALLVWGLFAQPVTAEENIHFSSCREAWENGYSDIHRGEPGYSSKLDLDGDGIACERDNAPRGVFKPRQSGSQSSITVSGWVKQDGYWYYFAENGHAVRNAWQGSYYLKSDGKMATNEWVDGGVDGGRYYVDASGLWKP